MARPERGDESNTAVSLEILKPQKHTHKALVQESFSTMVTDDAGLSRTSLAMCPWCNP